MMFRYWYIESLSLYEVNNWPLVKFLVQPATICLCPMSSLSRKTSASYRELEARKDRVNDLEKLYMDMALKKELQVFTLWKSWNSIAFLNAVGFAWKTCENKYGFVDQKKGRKRKLREDEIVCPTSKPVYKWRAERKRWTAVCPWLFATSLVGWIIIWYT